MQRLIIRLTIVALMVSCGVYLIVQSQHRGDAIASQDSENLVLPPRAKAKAADPINEPGATPEAGVYDDIGPIQIGAEQVLDDAAPHDSLRNPLESSPAGSTVQPSAYQQESPSTPPPPTDPGTAYGGNPDGGAYADPGYSSPAASDSAYGQPLGDANSPPTGPPPTGPPPTEPSAYAGQDSAAGDPYGALPFDPTAGYPAPDAASGASTETYGAGNAPPDTAPAMASLSDSAPASNGAVVDPYKNLRDPYDAAQAEAPAKSPESPRPSATISGLAVVAPSPQDREPAALPGPPAPAPGLGEFQETGGNPAYDAPPYDAPAYGAPAADAPAYDAPAYSDAGTNAVVEGDGGQTLPTTASPDPQTPPNEAPMPSNPAPAVLADSAPAARTMQALSARANASPSPAASILPNSAGLAASALPGDVGLEGRLTPTVTIEKRAPEEVQVGRVAEFTILVRNDGRVPAQDVTVIDRVPQGAKFAGAEPDAQRTSDGALYWNLGELPPGATRELVMQVIPEQEGEIGSVARVVFQTAASARTMATRPELKIEHTGPKQVLIGRNVTYAITISNPGTGAAYGVTLEADIPEGLRHPRGQALEYTVGMLKPGESRALQLTLAAEHAGVVVNRLVVRGDGDLMMEDKSQLQIIAPDIQASIEAPTKRYVDRPARYEFRLSNVGTAAGRDVELAAYLPRGMKFDSANNHGEYDARQHAVYWSLVELGPNQNDSVELVATPRETGEHILRFEGKGALGVAISQEHKLDVFTLNELSFTVADIADPIEVGSKTTYEIRVTNQGSKPDSNIQVLVELPQGMQPQPPGEGQRYTVQQQIVAFPDLQTLAPNASATLRFQALGQVAGDHRIRVQVVSQESPTPVVKEEATRVYADR